MAAPEAARTCRSLQAHPVTAKEAAEWLIEGRPGRSPENNARQARVPVLAAVEAMRSAMVREERLERELQKRVLIMFPVGEPFAPAARCPHRGPIPPGRREYCAVCDASGYDDDPAFKAIEKHRPPSRHQQRAWKLREKAECRS